MPGRYHRVRRGETLWRISKRYHLPIKTIIEVNKIADPRQIKAGEMLFIPSQKTTERWKVASRKKRSKIETRGPFQDFIWPLKGRVVSVFGHIRNGVNNKGIDIQANSDSNIYASREGVVAFVGRNLPGWGKTIIIDHRDGFQTVYSGLSQIEVETGDRVRCGDTIARIVTSKNRLSCLHFEIREGHIPRNPLYYLPR